MAMMNKIMPTGIALGALLLAGTAGMGVLPVIGVDMAAHAQTADEVMPAQTPDEVNTFKLSEEFLAKMERVQIALSKLDTAAFSDGDEDTDPSFDSMTKDIQSKPPVMAILNGEGLEPRAYIVGYFALMSSLAAAEAENEPQMVDELKDINPEHLAFGKTYRDRIQQLLGE